MEARTVEQDYSKEFSKEDSKKEEIVEKGVAEL
jgi:hypothetical protein